MPRVNTWNGKWTGAENRHIVVLKIPEDMYKHRREELNKLNEKSFDYDFGDGWAASILVKFVNEKDARALVKQSKGFCDYKWMIASILCCGEIDRNIKDELLFNYRVLK